MMELILSVPTKHLTPDELVAEAEYINEHGTCLEAASVGRLHIGAPMRGESVVSVFRREDDKWIRYEMPAGDAALLIASCGGSER